jgi:hypothetical protein
MNDIDAMPLHDNAKGELEKEVDRYSLGQIYWYASDKETNIPAWLYMWIWAHPRYAGTGLSGAPLSLRPRRYAPGLNPSNPLRGSVFGADSLAGKLAGERAD